MNAFGTLRALARPLGSLAAVLVLLAATATFGAARADPWCLAGPGQSVPGAPHCEACLPTAALPPDGIATPPAAGAPILSAPLPVSAPRVGRMAPVWIRGPPGC